MHRVKIHALTLLTALFLGCGGSGPDADAGKSNDEVRKSAESMDKADIEKVIEEYKKAIDAEKDGQKLEELKAKMQIYVKELARKASEDLKKNLPGG